MAGSREKGKGDFTDPPVHPAFPPRARSIQAPLCSALPSSPSVGPVGDSPLPSGVQAEVFAQLPGDRVQGSSKK